jgi:hypothetical protein
LTVGIAVVNPAEMLVDKRKAMVSFEPDGVRNGQQFRFERCDGERITNMQK